ncbi:MAG: GNAT family N-acetyltransferase [Bacteroidales bacterium]|nr:GNAT family N-acetyltransferase [Bacteroidales bacterium]
MNDFFQSRDCLEFYRSLSFLEPFYFEVRREKEVKASVVGYIQKDGGALKRFLSRRAIINGGPYLAPDATRADLTELLTLCKKGLKGKAIYIESRNFEDYSLWKDVFEEAGFLYEPHYDFQVDATTVEIAETNLGKSRKRDIRTSLREGAEIIDYPDNGQILSYYALLEKLYRNKVKTPLFPAEFFLTLAHQPYGKILLVALEGRIIGGTTLACGRDCVYEWFVCGEDGIYKNIYPSTLATWSGIGYAAGGPWKSFDMMGAGAPGDGGYGVRDFKAKFGGKLVEFGRFRCLLEPGWYRIGKLGVRLMKKLG